MKGCAREGLWGKSWLQVPKHQRVRCQEPASRQLVAGNSNTSTGTSRLKCVLYCCIGNKLRREHWPGLGCNTRRFRCHRPSGMLFWAPLPKEAFGGGVKPSLAGWFWQLIRELSKRASLCSGHLKSGTALPVQLVLLGSEHPGASGVSLCPDRVAVALGE